MVAMDAEPDRLAPLAPPVQLASAGFWVVRARCCADTMGGVLTCPRASVRGRVAPPNPGPTPALAGALLLIMGRERIRSRRGCCGCCAGRMGPRSPPSWNPPAGSRTRCVGSLPAWCARIGSECYWALPTIQRGQQCCTFPRDHTGISGTSGRRLTRSAWDRVTDLGVHQTGSSSRIWKRLR